MKRERGAALLMALLLAILVAVLANGMMQDEQRRMKLLDNQRVRDEAHRVAITAHRNKRTRLGLTSRLDSVPGIGPARRKALLAYFGSIENILAASDQELLAIPGITPALANALRAHLE